MGSTEQSRRNAERIDFLEKQFEQILLNVGIDMQILKKHTGQTEFLDDYQKEVEKNKLKYDYGKLETADLKEVIINEQNNLKDVTLETAKNAKEIKRWYYIISAIIALLTGIKYGVLNTFIK